MTTKRAFFPLLLLLLATAAPLVVSSNTASAADTGTITLTVTLQAGPESAARTWRFEVLNASGTVVESLNASTSGPKLSDTITSAPLAPGRYTVRQVLTNDTKTGCTPGAFFEVTAPVGASLVVEVAAAAVPVAFTIRPCAALPTDLNVQTPIDVVAPPSGGVIGEAEVLPDPVIDEVRGARSEGPLAPSTGTSPLTRRPASTGFEPLLLLASILALSSSAGLAVAAVRQRHNR